MSDLPLNKRWFSLFACSAVLAAVIGFLLPEPFGILAEAGLMAIVGGVLVLVSVMSDAAGDWLCGDWRWRRDSR